MGPWNVFIPGVGYTTIRDQAVLTAVLQANPTATVSSDDPATAQALGVAPGVGVDASIPLQKWAAEQALAWTRLQNDQAQTGINAYTAQANAANTAQGNAISALGAAGNLFTSLRGPKNYGQWSSLMFGRKSGAISPMLAAMAGLTGGLSYTPTSQRSALNWKSAGIPALLNSLTGGAGGAGNTALAAFQAPGAGGGVGTPSAGAVPAGATAPRAGTTGFTVPTTAGLADPNMLQVGTANGTGPGVRNELGLGGGTGGLYTTAVPRVTSGSKQVSRNGYASRDDRVGYYEDIGNPDRALISYGLDPLDEGGNLIRPMWVDGQLVEPDGWDHDAWRYPARNPINQEEEYQWGQYVKSGFDPALYPAWAAAEEGDDYKAWLDRRNQTEAGAAAAADPESPTQGAADAAAQAAKTKAADPTQSAYYGKQAVEGESADQAKYRQMYGQNPALLAAAQTGKGVANAMPGGGFNGQPTTIVTHADGTKTEYVTATGARITRGSTATPVAAPPVTNGGDQPGAGAPATMAMATPPKTEISRSVIPGTSTVVVNYSDGTSEVLPGGAAASGADINDDEEDERPGAPGTSSSGPSPVSRSNSKNYGSGSGNKPPPGYRAAGGSDPIGGMGPYGTNNPSVRQQGVGDPIAPGGSVVRPPGQGQPQVVIKPGQGITDVQYPYPSTVPAGGGTWGTPGNPANPQFYQPPARGGGSAATGGGAAAGGAVPAAGPTAEELDLASRWAGLQWGVSKEEAYDELIGNGPDPQAAAAYLLGALGMIRAGQMAGLLGDQQPGQKPETQSQAKVETGAAPTEPAKPPSTAPKPTTESQADREKRYSATYEANPALKAAAAMTGKSGKVIANATPGAPIDGQPTTVVTFNDGTTAEFRTADGARVTRGPAARASGGTDMMQPGLNLVTDPVTMMRNGQQFIMGENSNDELVANLPDRVITWPLQNREIPVPGKVARLANEIVPGNPYRATPGLLNWQAEALERPGYTSGFRQIKMAAGGALPVILPGLPLDNTNNGMGPGPQAPLPPYTPPAPPSVPGHVVKTQNGPETVPGPGAVPGFTRQQGRWIRRADGSVVWQSGGITPSGTAAAAGAAGGFIGEGYQPHAVDQAGPMLPHMPSQLTPAPPPPMEHMAAGGMDPLMAGGPPIGSSMMQPDMGGGAEGEMGIEQMPPEPPMESGEPNEQALREFVASQQGIDPNAPPPDAPLEQIIAYVSQVAPELLDEQAMTGMSQGDLLKQKEPTSMSQGGDSWLRTRMPGLFARAMKKGGNAPLYKDPAPVGNLGPSQVGNASTLSGMGKVWASAKPFNLQELDRATQMHYNPSANPSSIKVPGEMYGTGKNMKTYMPKNWNGLPGVAQYVNDAGQVQAQTGINKWKRIPQGENSAITDPSNMLSTTAEDILQDPVLMEMISSQLAQRGEAPESYWARANAFRIPSIAPQSLGMRGVL